MTSGAKTILSCVTDLAAAKVIVGALLSAAPTADAPYYVGYRVAGQDIGLVPNDDRQRLAGATPY